MATDFASIVRDLHGRLARVGPETDPELFRERGLRLDPAGEFRFRRTGAEVLSSGLATGCDDYARAFLEQARAGGIETRMVWSASEREIAGQVPGRELSVDGLPLVLDPSRPARLVSGHQFVAVREGSVWRLVDPSHEGQDAIEVAGPIEALAGRTIPWESIDASWPVLAAKLRERGREGDGLAVRRVDADPGAGNSVERLMKIYASGDPGAPDRIVRAIQDPTTAV